MDNTNFQNHLRNLRHPKGKSEISLKRSAEVILKNMGYNDKQIKKTTTKMIDNLKKYEE